VCLESKYRVGTPELENVSGKSFRPKTRTIQILVRAHPRRNSKKSLFSQPGCPDKENRKIKKSKVKPPHKKNP